MANIFVYSSFKVYEIMETAPFGKRQKGEIGMSYVAEMYIIFFIIIVFNGSEWHDLILFYVAFTVVSH